MITPLWQLLKGHQINNIIRSEESVFTDPKNIRNYPTLSQKSRHSILQKKRQINKCQYERIM